MNLVTIVNRTSKTLKGTWDGRHYEIEPGKHSYPELQAIKFREQNPIMGTEDRYTGEKLYLMGIVEHGDPITPVEQSDSITLTNITDKLRSGEYKVVKAEGVFRPADASPPMPSELAFVKP